MKRPDSKNLTLLSASGVDIAVQLERLGWSVHEYAVGAEVGAEGRPLVIDARVDIGDLSAMPDGEPVMGGAVAITEEGSDYQALIGMGISHFLPWPCDDALMGATLDAVGASLAAHGAEDDSENNLSDRDRLTGLMSRSAARAWLDARLDGAADAGISSCLLIGISQFANVNAAYGKVAGDAVLARAAARIVRCIERSVSGPVMIARMGGTEYLVTLTGDETPAQEGEKDAGSAEDIARLILSHVSQPFIADDQVIRLTARCGIAEPVAGDDAASLLRRANAALADARRSTTSDISKRSARGRGGNKAHGGDADRLDADLRLALDRGEIGIVYQPQYDSLTDRILGVEALARWNHPTLGQLDAGTLFEAADRSDYLLPLSLHIQGTALEEAGRWPASLAELRLAINVTAADLAQDDFVTLLFDMVDQSGFPRHRLTVEITENELIENIDRAGVILQELRKEGLWVAIDDFGTGYSSLAYLKSLHPDYLKIDHSLSRDILGTPRDRIILRAIIAMARSLALTVVAEGVESEQQLTLLAREGCDIYQGFLRSPAVTSDELVKLVEAG